MEHQALDVLRQKAAILDTPLALSSKKARLLRWAHLLEQQADAKATLVHGFEFGHQRIAILKEQWCDDHCSPFRVAFADPALRAEGFASGTYKEAIQFFQLTNREVHYLLCDCHYVPGATFGNVAQRVRRLAVLASLRDCGAILLRRMRGLFST
jgi:hypothetical protein